MTQTATALPERMRVVEIASFGGPEGLKVAERPVLPPGRGEVLIKVAAAGVNRPDVMQRLGKYPPPPGAPDIPGLEVSGEIVACGPDAGDWQIGDRVCALVAGGGYAEYCAAPAPQCLPVPDGVDLEAAAGLPENWFTVWTNMVDRGRMSRGEKVLVQGGASGIGTAAIQLAGLIGAEVFATAGTEEKCRFCEELGAKRGINYRSEDFVDAIKEGTGDRGVDLVLDMVGGDYIPRELSILAPEGRLVLIAFLGGSKAEVDFLSLMVKRLTVTGSTLRPRDIAFKGAIAEALRRHVWPRFADGTVRPIIDSRFPFEEAPAAHARIDATDHVGKILLVA